jgi:hypothetical protein
MDVSSSEQTKITRIRTFKDDVARARTMEPQTHPPETLPKQIETAPVAVAPVADAQIHTPHHTQSGHIEPPLSYEMKKPSPARKPVSQKITAEDIAQVAKTQQTSILSDEGVHTFGEGTIVRDTKHKRFRIIPALIEATRGWFSNTKDAYAQVLVPPQKTVAKAETRLETIRKAIEQGRQAPRDDYAQVVTTLKSAPRAEIKTGIIIKDKDAIPEPTWTHTTDSTDTALKEKSAQYIPQENKRQTQADTVVPPQLHEVPLSEQPLPAQIQDVSESVPTPATRIQAPTSPEVYTQRQNVSQKNNEVTRTSYRYVVAGISFVLCASLLGIGVSYYFFGDTQSTVTIIEDTPYKAPALFSSTQSQSFELGSNRETLLDTLTTLTQANNPTDVTHLEPLLLTSDGETVPAEPGTILNTLALRVDGSFARNVRDIQFGAIGTTPFILMRVGNFDTAFGGILAWEDSMSADLAYWFGDPVNESFNPEARTRTQTTEPFFSDVIANNSNARLLVDAQNNDRIIYTFLTPQLLLITTTREGLSEIAPYIR